MTAARIIFFLHLVGFAAYLGAGFAQLQLLKRSESKTGDVRKELEELAAKIIVMIELPSIMLQLATGIAKVLMTPEYLKLPWLHAKLTFVLILLILSHVEMFNARAIVRLREDGAKEDEIDKRKKRQQLLGKFGAALVVGVLVCVTIGLR